MRIQVAFIIGLLLCGTALAQYWPGTPSPGSYSFSYTDAWGNTWTDPAQQAAWIMQQAEAELQRLNQLFIDFYRRESGDYSSLDYVALERGKDLHCQRDPLDCQLAIQGSRQAMQDQQANFNTHQAIMQDRYAANDASFNSWMQQQGSQYAAGQAFIQGVIHEESNYTNPVTGTTYSLPFAPSAGGTYQTHDGYPLVFDATGGTWYQLDVNGGFTPYYGR